MVLTFILFLVLIVAFVAMFGVVKFAENVIAKPQFAPLNDPSWRCATTGIQSPSRKCRAAPSLRANSPSAAPGNA